mgnify:CR=1 FL=1
MVFGVPSRIFLRGECYVCYFEKVNIRPLFFVLQYFILISENIILFMRKTKIRGSDESKINEL